MGPLVYIRHLLSGPRLPFTVAYFGSISLTLYFAIGVGFSFTFIFYLFNDHVPSLHCFATLSRLTFLVHRVSNLPSPLHRCLQILSLSKLSRLQFPLSKNSLKRENWVQHLAMSVLLMAAVPQLHSTLLTLCSSIFQLAALLWYLVSYFPMGSTGLQFMGRIGAQRVTAWVSS
jgi:Got1/Sft2-like family